MLEKEFKFYIQNRDSLIKQYEGKYLIIKGEKVIDAFDSEIEAYTEARKHFKLGEFLLQPCSKMDGSIRQTFHSRVIFN